MELRHLRYFVAVAEELNYRKASERLHVATPALSSQIKDLERELSVRLLERDTGGVWLTDAGKAFLAEARLILSHSQHAMAVAQNAEQGRSGRLAVGFSEPLFMGFMPASLMTFHSRFPEIDVRLVEMSVADQLAALESDQIQIGFSISPGAHLPRGIRQIKLAHSPVRAVMTKHHRLAGAWRVALTDLVAEPLVSLLIEKDSTPLHRELIRRLFVAHGLKAGPIKQIEGSEAFRAALEGGTGMSLVPTMGGLSRSRVLAFKRFKDRGADLAVNLHALWRDVRTSPIAANFVAVLREIAPPGNPRA